MQLRDSQNQTPTRYACGLMERAMGQNGIGIWKKAMGLITRL